MSCLITINSFFASVTMSTYHFTYNWGWYNCNIIKYYDILGCFFQNLMKVPDNTQPDHYAWKCTFGLLYLASYDGFTIAWTQKRVNRSDSCYIITAGICMLHSWFHKASTQNSVLLIWPTFPCYGKESAHYCNVSTYLPPDMPPWKREFPMVCKLCIFFGD